MFFVTHDELCVLSYKTPQKSMVYGIFFQPGGKSSWTDGRPPFFRQLTQIASVAETGISPAHQSSGSFETDAMEKVFDLRSMFFTPSASRTSSQAAMDGNP